MFQCFTFFGRSLVFFSVILRGGGSSLQTTDLLQLSLLGPAIITNWICVQSFPESEQTKSACHISEKWSKCGSGKCWYTVRVLSPNHTQYLALNVRAGQRCLVLYKQYTTQANFKIWTLSEDKDNFCLTKSPPWKTIHLKISCCQNEQEYYGQWGMNSNSPR